MRKSISLLTLLLLALILVSCKKPVETGNLDYVFEDIEIQFENDNDTITRITGNLILPLESNHEGVTLKWNSLNKDVITNNGEVTRQDIDVEVTLVLTATKGKLSLDNRYEVLVKARNIETPPEEPLDMNLLGMTISHDDEPNNDLDIKDYYLTKSDSFTLNIHLNNEHNYSINSLIVNEKMYFTNDFTVNSTNTLIQLDFDNITDAGIHPFELELIIYNIDGNEHALSSRRNNQINLHIEAENSPSLNITYREADVFNYHIDFTITDIDKTIDLTSSNITLKVFEGGLLVNTINLTDLSNKVNVDNLKLDQSYTYEISANYNNHDGNVDLNSILAEGSFKTKAPITLTQEGEHLTSINYSYIKAVDEVEVSKIELFLNGTFIKEVALNATLITDLNSNTNYNLLFTYNYVYDGVSIEKTQSIIVSTNTPKMTTVIRNGSPVPFTGGGNVQIPDYIEQNEELRAVWLSTVSNIDIEQMSPTATGIANYKNEITTRLDNIKNLNMNAVFFQIRPMNDAWYESDLAPWSRYITGTEGVDPGFDILAFAIEEAHARGIELHGWLNPYRVATSTYGLSLLSPENFAYNREDLWLQGTNTAGAVSTILDPGIPEVQDYIVDVIDEIITKYPTINGIHFDDYFYLDESMIGENSSSPDYNTYQTYKTGNESFNQFRINSVTTIIRNIYNNIEAFNNDNNASVKFGISPSGIWDNKGSNPDGSDTTGWSHLRALHADTKGWIDEGIIHYIVPQIYWDFNLTAARYANLVDWWAGAVSGTDVDLIIGMGPYRLRNTNTWPVRALEEQLRFNQLYSEVIGSAFFTYQDIVSNVADVPAAMAIIRDELWLNEVTVPWETNIYNN